MPFLLSFPPPDFQPSPRTFAGAARQAGSRRTSGDFPSSVSLITEVQRGLALPSPQLFARVSPERLCHGPAGFGHRASLRTTPRPRQDATAVSAGWRRLSVLGCLFPGVARNGNAYDTPAWAVLCVGWEGGWRTVGHLWRPWSDAFSEVASGVPDACVRARRLC